MIEQRRLSQPECLDESSVFSLISLVHTNPGQSRVTSSTGSRSKTVNPREALREPSLLDAPEAGTTFPRIPFHVWFWVRVGHIRSLLAVWKAAGEGGMNVEPCALAHVVFCLLLPLLTVASAEPWLP